MNTIQHQKSIDEADARASEIERIVNDIWSMTLEEIHTALHNALGYRPNRRNALIIKHISNQIDEIAADAPEYIVDALP